MSKVAGEYLKHILDEVEFILIESRGLTEEEFARDEVLKRAFSRSLEIIGEAAKNLPKEYKNVNKGVDWKSLAGLRDRLIHHYFGVDYGIVWDVVINELPELRKKILELI
jgi:uncharacterized protein with HEPN domain